VHLPAALTGAADVYVRVVVTDDAIADTILSVTGRRPRDLPPAFCAGLDLLDIAAGIRVGDRADTAVARLRAASHARTIVDGDVASAPAFASLVGYGEAKDWGAALIEDLADWRLGKTRFEDILGRAILVSEPGLGKTTFVRSLAFATSLPLIVTSVSAWFSGLSMGNLDSVIKAVDEVFASARSVPGGHAIVFIDEIDAVPNRATLDSRNREWWLPVVTHILLTLDSAVSSANAGTIVIGATNHVEHLDKALLRRLGRVLRIGLPDADARAGILREHLHGEIAAADLEAVARLAHGMTGSDLAEAVKNARGKARGAKRRLEVSDLAAAIAPADTRSPEDRRIAAIHEAGHVVAQLAVGYSVESVSIVERGGSGGATIGRGLSGVPTRRQLDDHIVVLLSGRAAETVILGRATTGAGGAADSDLARAATTAVAIHTSYGLADSLLWRGPPAEALARMDPALRTVIDSDLVRLHARALALVGSRRPAVEAIAGRLLRDRFLSSDEIRRVVADAERSEIVAVEGTTGGLR
jgi:ATP-dependent Zn protease